MKIRSALGNNETQQTQHQKQTTKIFEGLRRKEKTAAIFFDIKKAYDKVNRDKKLEQLENMGIQGRMLRFIRELIGERWKDGSK